MKLFQPLAILLFFIAGTHLTSAKEKNFIYYYTQVNLAEQQFVHNNVKECMSTYDRVFKEYSEPFVSDCYIAAQIAYSSGDTIRFVRYLGVAFKNGMPITAIDAAPMLRNITSNTSLYDRIQRSFSDNAHFFKIDTAAVDSLNLMSYVADGFKWEFERSKFKNESLVIAFIKQEEESRKFVYRKYISHGIFPLEKVTGIRTDNIFEDFEHKYHKTELWPEYNTANMPSGMVISGRMKNEWELSNTLGFNIFIHSTCTISEYGLALWQCVLNGYMHPKDYGMLEEMSISWNRTGPFAKYAKICDYEKKTAYYNILANAPFHSINTFTNDAALLQVVEKNRADHYIQQYSIDVEKKRLEKEKGFKFFFGFSQNR